MFNSKVKSNTNTDIRERCYKFSLDIIALADILPNKRSAWIIIDQLIRSATSIGANIVESKSSSSRLEFKKFYEISLKSANETKYWLGLLRDSKLADDKKINALLSEVNEISNILAKAVMTLKRKSF